jgi:hypothetical protein
VSETLTGAAFVTALIAIAVTLVLASEVNALRREVVRSRAVATPLPRPAVGIGSSIPTAIARTAAGGSVDLTDSTRRLLLFVGIDCRPCDQLLGQLSEQHWTLPLDLLIVMRATPDGIRSPATHTVLDADGALGQKFDIHAVPTAVVIRDGRIEVVEQVTDLEHLMAVVGARQAVGR